MHRGRLFLGVAIAVASIAALSAPGTSMARADVTLTPPITIAPATGTEITAEAERIVSAMTVDEQAASVVMGHIPTTDAAALSDYMTAAGLGGFILMGANIPSDPAAMTAVTQALTANSDIPPLIAIDQEGGVVSRLPWDTYAGPNTLKNAPVTASAAAYAVRGALVHNAGATVNFGIVADATADASSFIFSRALGADPASAADRVAAAVAAEEPAVASTLKHFPGHGAAPGDSHQTIPTTTKSLAEWRTTDAVPFQAGVDAGASLLMFGHLAYTAVDAAPATLSAEWHRIAREELGFDGVIVTDDLGMLQSSGVAAYADPVQNAVTAIAAGNDLVLTVVSSTAATAPAQAAGIAAAVAAGTISEERLHEAAVRVMTLRLTIAGAPAHWSLQP